MLLLIAINGFFVAGEFALVAVNRSRVDREASDGDRRAARLAERLKDLSFELSGAQLGITVTSLIIGAVAEDTVARLLEPLFDMAGVSSTTIILGTALIVATVFQMVVGELFPKNVAIAKPYPSAIRVGLPMAFVNQLLRPIITMFNSVANWTVRLFGIEPRDELAGLRSLRELDMIVRASSEQGVIGEHEKSLLTRAISFVERDAADAMVARVNVAGIEATASVEELRELAVETGYSRFPVYEGDIDSIVGVAYVKDTFRIDPGERAVVNAADIAQPAHRSPEAMGLDALLADLRRNGRTISIVVDEYGGTAGIVTVEDIVEEILGEIEDEYDAVARHDAVGVLDGTLHRHEVEERTGFGWPEGNYETLNGFITDWLERFPVIGDVVELDERHRLEVLAVDGDLATRIQYTMVGKPREADL